MGLRGVSARAEARCNGFLSKNYCWTYCSLQHKPTITLNPLRVQIIALFSHWHENVRSAAPIYGRWIELLAQSLPRLNSGFCLISFWMTISIYFFISLVFYAVPVLQNIPPLMRWRPALWCGGGGLLCYCRPLQSNQVTFTHLCTCKRKSREQHLHEGI